MYIYQGKVNWPSHIEDENFTVLFSDEIEQGESVHVYWQEVSNIEAVINKAHLVLGKISNKKTTEAGTKFQFTITHDHDKDYQFDATLSADKKTMVINIRNGDEYISSSLQLVSSPNLIIKASWTESLVYNDTDKVYYCSLSDSSNFIYWKNTVLAGLGGYFGVVGFVTAFLGLPAPAGVALAGVALVPATYSFYDTQKPPDAPVEGILGPGISLFRAADGNDLMIVRLTIDGSNLTIATAIKTSLAGGITKLSDIVNNLDWKTFLVLNVGSNRNIETRSLMMMDNFRLNNNGGSNSIDGANLIEYPIGTMLNLPRETSSSPKINKLFNFQTSIELILDRKYNYGFIATGSAAQTSSESGMIELNPSNPMRQVWRMWRYFVDYDSSSPGVSLGIAGGDLDVKKIISREINHNYVAYYWEGQGKPVFGYREDGFKGIKAQGNAGNGRVYIPIKMSLLYQKLV